MHEVKSTLERIGKVIAKIFFILLTILIVSGGIIYYITDVRKHDLLNTTSPDGLYTLNFQQVGEPAWFGSATVKVTVKGVKNTEKEDFEESFTSSIANDGGNACSSDCTVKWNKDYVQIELSGEEQPVDTHIINFDNK